MNKKVGIITVHKNVNYGANLQAFATNKFFNDSGFDCCVLDYTLPSEDKQNKLFSWLKQSWDNEPNKSLSRKVKLFIALALSMGWKGKRLKAFSNFRKNHVKLSKPLKSKEDFGALDINSIVCGSDQIWNPDIIGSINPIYFGNVLGVKNKISYAPSVGKEKYIESDEELVIPLIKALDYASVREADTAKYLQELSGRNIETVCDPVFLLDKEVYDSVSTKRLIKGDYVLLYSVVHNDKLTEIAVDYARRNGLKLIEIASSKDKDATHKQILNYGPSEFLSAIKHAKTVITNSFHGTAFSIIYEKDFYVYNNKARGSRILNVLEKAGLSSRLVESEIISNHATINYGEVNDSLLPFIKSSKEFLLNALNVEKEELAGVNCIGCGACASVCSVNAIKLVTNSEGFITSVVDKTKCVNCNLCKKVCPALNEVNKNQVSKSVYAFKATNEIRKNSTSGGAFTALAVAFLKNGGVVYGATLIDNESVKHVRITSESELSLLQGTKYIPSDISSCYHQVLEDLSLGKRVLFSGTPCQTDGINRFLTLKKANLSKFITVDIICHGVPSPRLFSDYKSWFEKEEKCEIEEYYFRNKKVSWHGSSCYAKLKDGRVIVNTKKLCGFMNLYYSNNITRESCYTCKYTSYDRVSDITVSDYWGIEKLDKSFEDALGVSMVIINTKKGEELFLETEGEKIAGSFETANQTQLKSPTKKPLSREAFWKEYNENGIDFTLKKHGAVKDSFKTKLYKIKKKIFR